MNPLEEERERVLAALSAVDSAEDSYRFNTDPTGQYKRRLMAAEDELSDALLAYFEANEASLGREPYQRGAA